MTLLEAVTIVFGLFAGYWVVSRLLFRSSPKVEAPSPQSGGATWPQVLNVDPAASIEEIHAAYGQLISQYHPDKVEQLGPEIKNLAARRAQEITAAYHAARAAKGALT